MLSYQIKTVAEQDYFNNRHRKQHVNVFINWYDGFKFTKEVAGAITAYPLIDILINQMNIKSSYFTPMLFSCFFLYALMPALTVAADSEELHKPLAKAVQDQRPLILAHRASSGLWIQNSRNAVKNTIALYQENPNLLDGIEIDIVLTKDHIPVLAHDPWVHKTLCTHKDGNPVEEILIRHLPLEELQQKFTCGGMIDTDFPNAKVKAESVMSFAEFLLAIKETPELIIYLDIKLQPPLTLSSDAYAQAIFSHWDNSGATNPLYVEGPNKQAINAYQQYATQPFTAVLSYPPFFAEENWLIKGAWAALINFLHPQKAVNTVQAANAKGVATPTAVNNRSMQIALQNDNKQVIVFTPNQPKEIQKACTSGVDIIITDFPNRGPCQKHN